MQVRVSTLVEMCEHVHCNAAVWVCVRVCARRCMGVCAGVCACVRPSARQCVVKQFQSERTRNTN